MRVKVSDDQLMEHIRAKLAINGYSPSIRELAASTGKSLEWVLAGLERLEQAGRITRVAKIPRSIRVVEE